MDKNNVRTGKTRHVILGICMQTSWMTEMLEEAGAEDVAVIDYEAEEDVIQVASVYFYSPRAAKRKLKRGERVVYHKFLSRRK